MKKSPTYDEFLNEAISFGKKGIIAKAKQKSAIAQKAVDKWGESYKRTLEDTKKLAKTGKLPKYTEHNNVQGGESQGSYEIFQGRAPEQLASEIAKVIDKYKKHEVAKSSTGAAAGWSGTMRSTVGGDIQGRANFNPGGRRTYLIAVTCGSGVDRSIKDKMFQELYELLYIFDEFNGSDGGVHVDYSSGTNYDTIGLACSNYSFNSKVADSIKQIINK
jgi:hypothetical protein